MRRFGGDPVPTVENRIKGARNRLLQVCALYAPGSETLRVRMHRWRGVRMGSGVFIGTDAILETAYPHRLSIGDRVVVGHRALIIAHFRESDSFRDEDEPAVVIEDDVFIGPNVTILPNVTIGHGAVVTAGSVVSQSVPPLTMVQGVPARPVARCGVPLGMRTPLKEFYRQLRPLRSPARPADGSPRGRARDERDESDG
jgi:acetyltransferase-like isoleucine patch superfamily enzyme